MPSGGMRKSPRVLGARVLRSGRRLSTESREKPKNMSEGDGGNKLIEILDHAEDGGGNFNNQLEDANLENVDNPVREHVKEHNKEESSLGYLSGAKNVDRRWGIVYSRKRKRAESTDTVCSEDKRFGIKFYRRRWRKKNESNEQLVVCRDFQFDCTVRQGRALFVVNKSYDCGFRLASILASVLSYMARIRIRLQSLSTIMLSEPVRGTFASHGMLFLQDSIIEGPGRCIIWESESLIPLFSLDFFTIPSCFVLLHLNMSLRCAYSACVLNYHYLVVNKDDEIVANDSDKLPLQLLSGSEYSDSKSLTSQIFAGTNLSCSGAIDSSDDVENSSFSPPLVGPNRYSLRSIKVRNSRDIQKRRTSLRRKRGRPSSAIRAQKPSGALASEFLKIRQNGGQLSATPSRVLRSSLKRSSASKTNELNSSLDMAMRDASSTCLANLLIVKADQCYREEGATVSLELSDSRQWVLVITKNGEKCYNLTAEKTMRPPSSNRITHATIWTVDGTWKLEFINKQDWLIFKELYKMCFERNLQEPDSNDIPVPGVREVPNSTSTYYVPFVRPNSYITLQHDEPTRALMQRSAVYDMDSDDEEWLEKFNFNLHEFITPERFELVIDAIEKSYHCNPNEKPTYDSFVHLEKKEVIDAIRDHWNKKRKQSRSALVRIFQLHQARRSQVIPKPSIRKKRTVKRQASYGGRGKQRALLQVMAAEQKKRAERRVTEEKQRRAKAEAERFEELAILKRQRAQKLMENADLATYKAVMALKIAEAAAQGSHNLSATFPLN